MSYIYFIQTNSGPIKIGHSSRKYIKDRLIVLQVGNHEKLTLLCIMPGTKDTEKELHNKFKDFWIRGEWFQPNENLSKLIETLPYLGITAEIDNFGNKHPRWVGDNVSQHLKQARIKRIFTLGPCTRCNKPGNDYHFIDGDRNNLSPENITSYCRSCTMQADGRIKTLQQASQKSRQIRSQNKKISCDNCKISCIQTRRGRCRNCYKYFIDHNIERPTAQLRNNTLKRGPKHREPQKCVNCPKIEIIRLKSGKCHTCDAFFRRNKYDRTI